MKRVDWLLVGIVLANLVVFTVAMWAFQQEVPSLPRRVTASALCCVELNLAVIVVNMLRLLRTLHGDNR